MGAICTTLRPDAVIFVRTGDRAMAGTDANIKVILHDDSGKQSKEIMLDNYFKNDFETGSLCKFKIRLGHDEALLGPAKMIEFWRDTSGLCSGWYVDYISVKQRGLDTPPRDFPVFRWVKPGYRYKIELYDTALPQDDKHKNQRQGEIQDKQKLYQLSLKAPGMPAQHDPEQQQRRNLLLKKLNYTNFDKQLPVSHARYS
ncbi:lipoxygenase homology domain-containing protein 1-like [Liolophura sinensis]|uniref:lipoxygenase homology domain-containing protein 1-like n=1 Tax=Liolophura sinensis TaxID=3198878 RepID=UPI0031593968